MSRTNRRYKKKLPKQMLAEQQFESGEENNHKVANALTLMAGPTTSGHVRKMRSIWKKKLEKRLESNKEYQKIISKEVKSVREVYKEAILRIGKDMAEKELNEDNRTKAFNTLIQKVGS